MTTTTALPDMDLSLVTHDRWCEGCPRCTDPDAGFCKTQHERFGILHSVCKRCGHCVWRGTHVDKAEDLDGHQD